MEAKRCVALTQLSRIVFTRLLVSRALKARLSRAWHAADDEQWSRSAACRAEKASSTTRPKPMDVHPAGGKQCVDLPHNHHTWSPVLLLTYPGCRVVSQFRTT